MSVIISGEPGFSLSTRPYYSGLWRLHKYAQVPSN